MPYRDECGVFGIYGHSEAANLTYLGLYALQHRGQESVGIATSDGGRLKIHKAMGYVADTFNEAAISRLDGMMAIGHVRYSTAGDSGLKNAQPILIDCAHGEIAICHNGNIVNAQELRESLVRQGSIFQTTSDTEVLLHLYARSQQPPIKALVESVIWPSRSMNFVRSSRICACASSVRAFASICLKSTFFNRRSRSSSRRRLSGGVAPATSASKSCASQRSSRPSSPIFSMMTCSSLSSVARISA